MKNLLCCLLCILLLAACFSGCGGGAVPASEGGSDTAQAGASGTSAPETAPAQTEPPAPVRAEHPLGRVLADGLELWGRPSFTTPGGYISNVKGLQLAAAVDLDGDGEAELIMIHWASPEDRWNERMEIWRRNGLEAECIFTGGVYRAGVDNYGLQLLSGEDGSTYVRYSAEDSFSEQYLGCVRGGKWEVVHQLDYSSGDGNYVDDAWLIGGRRYAELAFYGLVCYEEPDSELWEDWKQSIQEACGDALLAFGLASDELAPVYTVGLRYLEPGNTLLNRADHFDGEGNFLYANEYDYDAQGRQTRVYRNSVLHYEYRYNPDGSKAYEATYNSEGELTDEKLYDEAGRLLVYRYNVKNNNAGWRYEYSYDEKGNKLTEWAGSDINGQREEYAFVLKRYEYNEDGCMIAAYNVNERDGSEELIHTFTHDGENRPVLDLLHRDGKELRYESWEYFPDGGRTETLWSYMALDDHGDRYSVQPGEETPAEIVRYDSEGRQISRQTYQNGSLQTEELSEFNVDGKQTGSIQRIYSNGQLVSEDSVQTEYQADGVLSKRTRACSVNGNPAIGFDSYLSEFNAEGLRVHAYTYDIDLTTEDPAPYLKEEICFTYQNAQSQLLSWE